MVCLHGVPSSCFLYRKVLTELAARGLRGVAFDLPGLGLAERPASFDYSWTGLGRFARAAIDALALERFHVVVHDIGGPVGFELAAAMPERIRSLTVLNTMVEVDTFRRPWSMEPFARRGLGEAYLATLPKPAFRMLFNLQGLGDRSAVPKEEVDAYVDLLKRDDHGRFPSRHARLRADTAETRSVRLDATRRPLSRGGRGASTPGSGTTSPRRRGVERLLMFAAMGAFLVAALAVPEAFD